MEVGSPLSITAQPVRFQGSLAAFSSSNQSGQLWPRENVLRLAVITSLKRSSEGSRLSGRTMPSTGTSARAAAARSAHSSSGRRIFSEIGMRLCLFIVCSRRQGRPLRTVHRDGPFEDAGYSWGEEPSDPFDFVRFPA